MTESTERPKINKLFQIDISRLDRDKGVFVARTPKIYSLGLVALLGDRATIVGFKNITKGKLVFGKLSLQRDLLITEPLPLQAAFDIAMESARNWAGPGGVPQVIHFIKDAPINISQFLKPDGSKMDIVEHAKNASEMAQIIETCTFIPMQVIESYLRFIQSLNN